MTAYPQLHLDQVTGPVAEIKTTLGTIKVQLFPHEAPKTVKNFVELAKRGYYDGVSFHRVIPDFMIQGVTPPALARGASQFTGSLLKMSFLTSSLISGAPYPWPMPARTPTEVNSSL